MVGSAHVRDAPWQMAERLQHISTMGFTAVELMPIHEFNELEYYSLNPSTGEHRFNFWGYSTVRQTAHTQTSPS
jgi:pullulanase/glycogen debranching enzyme